MAIRILKSCATIFLSVFLLCANLFGEIIHNTDFSFYLDLPEGFELKDYAEDGMSYLFEHPNIPVTVALKIYEGAEFTSSEYTLKNVLNRLSANAEVAGFEWNGQEAAITDFSLSVGTPSSGWAISAPLKKQNAYLALLCYAPDEVRASCNQFIMSVLNSLCVDEYYFNTPGIIVTYAFPPEGKTEISATIDKKRIQSFIDKVDVEASKFVVDLEYSVFLLYANIGHPLQYEAWKRYYGLVFRDNYGRIADFSQSVLNALYPECKITNPLNPSAEYAQKLLSWVQDFDYKRENQDIYQTDFTSLPAVLAGEGNDCDSRSLLICALLKAAGIESFLLVSPAYSHALAAADLNAPGQAFELEGIDKKFLMGETTAKVTWGMIASDQTDRSKWIPVILP